MHIKIKKGLDIPLSDPPVGDVKSLDALSMVGLDLSPFEDLRLRVLVKEGEKVKIGQPLAEDKALEGRVFLSCAAGTIKEIVRGEKRSIQTLVIEKDEEESYFQYEPLDYTKLDPKELIKKLRNYGLLSHVIARPLCRIADPERPPKSIFVKALESAPFIPPSEMQVKEHEEDFQKGLDVLSHIVEGRVHLVHHKDTTCNAFIEAKNVQIHTAIGPHPISNHSLHIYKIDPIEKPTDVVWTLSVIDVITIGKMVTSGKYHIDRVVSLAGSGCVAEKAGFFRARMGISLQQLTEQRLALQEVRIVSGGPLMGKNSSKEGYLGFFHTCVSVIKENQKREAFHFFRLGGKKYTATKTYLSGFYPSKKVDFTTNNHGENRAFVDGNIYEKVMPMRIPTMQLIKAIIAEDFDTAVELGLLEVAPEDFALATFICPSKNEMVQIVLEGLKKYSEETAL